MPKSTIILDLRHGGVLAAAMLRRLDEIMVRDFSTFNDMIATLSQGREHDIDWWVCRPATRNTHISVLHTHCTQLALIRELVDTGATIRVHLDCPIMAAVLARARHVNLNIVLKDAWKTRARRFIGQGGGILASLFHCTAAAFAAWWTRAPHQSHSDVPLTLINTFVTSQALREGSFHDRYYPELFNSLDAEEKACCRYVPVFHRIRNYLGAFRTLRGNPVPFLFYEDHLDISDYQFAFGHWLRMVKFLKASVCYAGFDIGPLVDMDAQSGRFSSTVVRALLAYRFHLRAKSRGLSIRAILDWYEGLDYNHAIAAAILWHNPQTAITGFRSAGSLYYMSCTPAPHEVAAGVTPRRMAVVGTGRAREIQSLCPDLDVIDAPGMRYRALATLQRAPSGESAVLIALPLSARLAADNIRMLAATRALMTAPPRHWWVKSHPVLPESEILAVLGGALPEGMEFVRGDFYMWLARAHLVAGVASSTLMESVAYGIPAICLATGNVPTEIPVPPWVDLHFSCITYDARETAKAIDEMMAAPPSKTDLAHLHHALLGEVNEIAIRRLLELD